MWIISGASSDILPDWQRKVFFESTSYICYFSVSSNFEDQVQTFIRCVRFLCRLFKQSTPIPAPGFDACIANGSGAVSSKAAMVFKVKYVIIYYTVTVDYS